MYNKTVYIVGIAGGTGSGKSTMAKKLKDYFQDKLLLIAHDRYYKDQSQILPEDRIKTNYDHPDALETQLLIKQLKELIEGKSVELPQYDFVHHTRSIQKDLVSPTPLILVEGILIYENKELRDLIDYKIYVDVPADIRFIRKVKRDIEERGRTFEMSTEQYLSTIRPMHEQYVEPTKQYADIIITEGGYNEKAVHQLINFLEKQLHNLAPRT